MQLTQLSRIMPLLVLSAIALSSCNTASNTSGGANVSSSSSRPSEGGVAAGCMTGGCSGEICTDEGGSEATVSACIYKEAYACYKTARCEKQASGFCGWTRTEELTSCIQNAEKSE